MKKTAWLVLAAMLLTGCQSVKTDPPGPASSDPGDDAAQNLGITAESTTWKWESREIRDDVAKVYRQAIQDCFEGVKEQIIEEDRASMDPKEYEELQNTTKDDGSPIYDPRDYVDVVFTLYDIDMDNMPELVLTYGTMIDDKLIAIYTYEDGKLKTIVDKFDAVRSYFAADTNTGEFVLVEGGGNGAASIGWYTIENGEFKKTRDSGEITYSEGETFGDILRQKGIAWIDFTEFYGPKKTWKIYYPDGEYIMEEPTDKSGDTIGFDYSQFEEMLG